MKPVLFVTGHAPAYRVEGLRLLHEQEGIELALFGGRSRHGGPAGPTELPVPTRRLAPRELWGLASSGRHRAVVIPTGGRVAPLAAWAGARRAGLPILLWASLWAHPRSAAHMLSRPLLGRLYRSADAVVAYGPHVSRYVRERGARNVHVAPQAVDDSFWRAAPSGQPLPAGWPADASVRFLFVGRDAPEKGLDVLRAAWRTVAASRREAALVIAGGATVAAPRAVSVGALDAARLRDVYAACDALIVPSVPTRTFREPWGLVVNEAMDRGLAVIASDAVGAAAGGLVRDGENGLIVPAGDAAALSAAIERLCADPQLLHDMGVRGAEDVRAYSASAWAEGFTTALRTLGLARDR